MKVFVNELEIEATNVEESIIEKDGRERLLLRFEFEVESEDSHRVTTEFYKNDFLVNVPDKNLEFKAVIQNYYTSITDLSIKGEVANFSLELIEK